MAYYKGTDYLWIDLEQDVYLPDRTEIFGLELECEVHLEYADPDLSADNPEDYYGGLIVEKVKVLYGCYTDTDDNLNEFSVCLTEEQRKYIESDLQDRLCKEAAELTEWSKDDAGGY